MIQQHNMKEENILYPMTDQLLGKIQPDMIDAMNKLDTGG
jgi:iron-sulfur cluster repair protein YtfE (RIC family)